jgi:hypothetical protein
MTFSCPVPTSYAKPFNTPIHPQPYYHGYLRLQVVLLLMLIAQSNSSSI